MSGRHSGSREGRSGVVVVAAGVLTLAIGFVPVLSGAAQAAQPGAVDALAPAAPSPSPSPTGSKRPSSTPTSTASPTGSSTASASGSATGAAPARPAPFKPVKITDALFGIHVFDVQNGAWPNVRFGSIRLWDNQTSWASIERLPGQFDWTALDAAVANAEKHRVKDIVLVLSATPKWASKVYTPFDLPSSGATGVPRSMSWWDRWVRNVATRYKGRITAYQVWNEANLESFYVGTPAEMADMTQRAYRIINKVDPQALVVAPSTGTRLAKPYIRFYTAFLQELKARNWPVDVFTGHFYPASTGSPVARQKLIEDWKTRLREAGAPDLPLWDTESNFGLAGPGPKYPDQDIEDVRAADWPVRAYLDALRLGLTRVYWYAWSPPIELLGIQMYRDTVAAGAVATLRTWIKGTTMTGCDSSKGLSTCTFQRKGKTITIAWAERDARPFRVPAGAGQRCGLDGACVAVKPRAKVSVAGPVRFGP